MARREREKVAPRVREEGKNVSRLDSLKSTEREIVAWTFRINNTDKTEECIEYRIAAQLIDSVELRFNPSRSRFSRMD